MQKILMTSKKGWMIMKKIERLVLNPKKLTSYILVPIVRPEWV